MSEQKESEKTHEYANAVHKLTNTLSKDGFKIKSIGNIEWSNDHQTVIGTPSKDYVEAQITVFIPV